MFKSTHSDHETENRKQFVRLFEQNPIPDNEKLSNLSLFMKRQDVSRFLFFNELYQKQMETNGVIFEFGVRWGTNLATFTALRGTYEPFNYFRKIVGFDTFKGFAHVDEKDGDSEVTQVGAFGVTDGYENYLSQVLSYLEAECPVSHIQKFELVKGDALKTVPDYLEKHPETIISMAYFDFDLYEPTKGCLGFIEPHLTRGSVIGFDQLNQHYHPGETIALHEAFGLHRFKICKSQFSPAQSYLVYDP
ncbi:MAG: crotonobetainyl-CoA--carnitine CoA-transferase [Magnetococcales bacterium]|nr:crotonobetainyl-CoA--carnitine CoA-transferase [Magnetococcales bacterium]